MTDKKREGGMPGGVDHDVKRWAEDAAENVSALTEKQKRDRARVRGRYDIPAWLKAEVDKAAKRYETSASQLAMLLLAWGLKDLKGGNRELLSAIQDHRALSQSLRFRYDLEVPSHLEDAVCDGPD